MQHQLVIKGKKWNTEKLLSYPILCPLCHLHQRNKIKTKFTILIIYFNVACQVNIVGKRGFYKTWTFYCSIPQHRDEMVYQTMHCSNKKSYQGIETEISWVDNAKLKCVWISNSQWYFTYHWCGIWSKTERAKTLTIMFHATVEQWAHCFTRWCSFTWIHTRQYKWCDN